MTLAKMAVTLGDVQDTIGSLRTHAATSHRCMVHVKELGVGKLLDNLTQVHKMLGDAIVSCADIMTRHPRA